MNTSIRNRIVITSLTVLFLVSSCSTVRPWVEGAVVVGHPNNASQLDSAQIAAIYSDYAVYIGFGPPSPIVGAGDGMDAQYAKSVDDYRSEFTNVRALILRPGKYRFVAAVYYVVKEFPTVEQGGGYTDIVESLVAEVGKEGGYPDVFLSVTPKSTIMATVGFYE